MLVITMIKNAKILITDVTYSNHANQILGSKKMAVTRTRKIVTEHELA